MLKRHSGAKKRFKLTKSLCIKARHQGLRHKLNKKSRARKRSLKKAFVITGGDYKRVLIAIR